MNKIVYFFSIVFYIVALTQKGFCTTAGQCAIGIMDLLVGWMGVLMLHPPAMVWLANPTLFAAWVFTKKNQRTSFILSVISLLIMLSFLLFDEIIVNESGASSKITAYGLGYWLWVLSAFIMVIGNGVLYYIKRKDG
ncbi:MAG: hypothetical protein J7K34_03950 [Flavobacteriaceae bacterium]|nr:hypothetical protein [Flavobacteriaceae bacterium]